MAAFCLLLLFCLDDALTIENRHPRYTQTRLRESKTFLMDSVQPFKLNESLYDNSTLIFNVVILVNASQTMID